MGTRADPLPPMPPPRAPRSGALSLAQRTRARVAKLTDDFRRADRFFKMRAGIVSAWAVISLVTLWATCPSSGPGNALGADVQVNRDSIMGVQLLVRNESTRIWENVVLTLDDGWRYTQPTMRPHDLVVLSMSHFKKGEEAPPRDYKPRALVIACGQGSDHFDLR
jgi:hypothetical protein